MNDVPSASKGWHARLRKQTARLFRWTLAWVLSVALATFGPVFLWSGDLFTALAIGINLAIGIGMILANKGHLLSMDELQQKIHLQAMAATLGFGLVVGIAYSSLDTAGIIPGPAEIPHMVLLMGVTYLVTVILLARKYQ